MSETLTIGSLFSGYGGLDLAVEAVTGATPAWFCEFDTAPSKVLAHHWPDVPNHRDVTAIDWREVEPVDILTGGSPCQDLSQAGKRAGMTEGTRSNLWVNMREAIATLRPSLVVWENVQGALSAPATSDSDMEPATGLLGNTGGGYLRALGRVLGDLTEIGYDTEWTTLRASDIGAPHHRARIFLIAWPRTTNPGGDGLQTRRPPRRPEAEIPGDYNSQRLLPDTTSLISNRAQQTRDRRARPANRHNRNIEWGKYAPAVRVWERTLGTPAPDPTEPNTKGNPRLAAPLRRMDDGPPHRVGHQPRNRPHTRTTAESARQRRLRTAGHRGTH